MFLSQANRLTIYIIRKTERPAVVRTLNDTIWGYHIYEIVFDLSAVSRRYHTCAIISRDLYIFYPIFEDHFLFSENFVLMHCYYQENIEEGMAAPAFSAVGPILLGCQLEQKAQKACAAMLVVKISINFSWKSDHLCSEQKGGSK